MSYFKHGATDWQQNVGPRAVYFRAVGICKNLTIVFETS